MRGITVVRSRIALRAGLWHLLASAFVACLAAVLVFFLWYPSPYSHLSGGRDLFLIVMAVDVVCGPLLTLILFNPAKPRRELVTDLSLVVLIQLGALVYGLYTVVLARPVFLAFELDRFRVVAPADVDMEKIGEAPDALRAFSYFGPKMMAVRVARPEDSDYLREVELAVNGQESTFRPERWSLYESQLAQVRLKAKPLSDLAQKYPERKDELAKLALETGLKDADLVWLPIRGPKSMAWVALVNKNTAAVVGFAPFDGF